MASRDSLMKRVGKMVGMIEQTQREVVESKLYKTMVDINSIETKINNQKNTEYKKRLNKLKSILERLKSNLLLQRGKIELSRINNNKQTMFIITEMLSNLKLQETELNNMRKAETELKKTPTREHNYLVPLEDSKELKSYKRKYKALEKMYELNEEIIISYEYIKYKQEHIADYGKTRDDSTILKDNKEMEAILEIIKKKQVNIEELKQRNYSTSSSSSKSSSASPVEQKDLPTITTFSSRSMP